MAEEVLHCRLGRGWWSALHSAKLMKNSVMAGQHIVHEKGEFFYRFCWFPSKIIPFNLLTAFVTCVWFTCGGSFVKSFFEMPGNEWFIFMCWWCFTQRASHCCSIEIHAQSADGASSSCCILFTFYILPNIKGNDIWNSWTIYGMLALDVHFVLSYKVQRLGS